jgi:hypothetical protein
MMTRIQLKDKWNIVAARTEFILGCGDDQSHHLLKLDVFIQSYKNETYS